MKPTPKTDAKVLAANTSAVDSVVVLKIVVLLSTLVVLIMSTKMTSGF